MGHRQGDGALGLGRGDVGPGGALVQALGLEAKRPAALQEPVPRRLALVGLGRSTVGGEQGPAAVAGEAVQAPLRLDQAGVDAGDLFFQQHVGALGLDLLQPLVVGGLEGLEGGHHLVHGGAGLGRGYGLFGFFHGGLRGWLNVDDWDPLPAGERAG